MTTALASLRATVTHQDVVHAMEEYDRSGRTGFSPSMVSRG